MGNTHPELGNFLTAVNYSYQQFDEDYFLLEHTTKSSLERVFIPLERLHERSAYAGTEIIWISPRKLHGSAYQYKSNWAKETNSTSLCLRVNLKLLKF
jgi:hypothetical protein